MESGPVKTTLIVPNNIDFLPIILAYVRENARKSGFDDRDIQRIELGTEEAVTNVIEHAFAPGEEKTISVRYEVIDGFYKSQKIKPVMVYRGSESNDLVVYNSRCTHLGCTVHWDDTKQIFLCACHGGAFDLNGNVKTGPPPRPLDKHNIKVEEGNLYVELA